MPKPVFNLRRLLFDDTLGALGEMARDLQKIFNSINPVEYKIATEFYKEPFTLGPFSEEPLCIELVRIVKVVQAQKPVKCGSLCHYYFKGGNAIITNIDGLTAVGTPVQYQFVFKVTYKAG